MGAFFSLELERAQADATCRNNQVTDDCPQKKGVSIRGQENCQNVEL